MEEWPFYSLIFVSLFIVCTFLLTKFLGYLLYQNILNRSVSSCSLSPSVLQWILALLNKIPMKDRLWLFGWLLGQFNMRSTCFFAMRPCLQCVVSVPSSQPVQKCQLSIILPVSWAHVPAGQGNLSSKHLFLSALFSSVEGNEDDRLLTYVPCSISSRSSISFSSFQTNDSLSIFWQSPTCNSIPVAIL